MEAVNTVVCKAEERVFLEFFAVYHVTSDLPQTSFFQLLAV